jgi:hypothetical protein
MRTERDRLRQAAYAADDAYTKELRRAYGESAGDMRYRFRHDDPAVQRAMEQKLAADAAYQKLRLL